MPHCARQSWFLKRKVMRKISLGRRGSGYRRFSRGGAAVGGLSRLSYYDESRLRDEADETIANESEDIGHTVCDVGSKALLAFGCEA